MKKTLIATTILAGLGASLAPVSSVYAQEANVSAPASQEGWLGAINTRIDLAQAKVSLLLANVALSIENAPDKAALALENAEISILQARESASEQVREQLDVLAQDVRDARAAIADAPDEALVMIDDIRVKTDARLQEYVQVVLDTDEAKLLQMRYAQLEARAALLRAQLAEQLDETGELARKHLDEAAAWYQSTKEGASDAWQAGLAEISTDINAAKQLIDEERSNAADAIVGLANRAADFIRGH